MPNSGSWWRRLREWFKRRPQVAREGLARQRQVDEEERRRREGG